MRDQNKEITHAHTNTHTCSHARTHYLCLPTWMKDFFWGVSNSQGRNLGCSVDLLELPVCLAHREMGSGREQLRNLTASLTYPSEDLAIRNIEFKV